MRSQAVGLAERLGLDFQEKRVGLRRPWSMLPGHLCPAPLSGLDPAGDSLAPPWPDLLISCGRRSTAVSIAIRRASDGATRTVHIQNPQTPLRHFDLVVSMRHDGLEGDNVVTVDTALHRVTPEKLASAAETWRETLRGGAESVVGFVLGGPTRHYWMSEAFLNRLKAMVAGVHEKTGARILVTPSRRTEERVADSLRAAFGEKDWYWQWDGRGDNPYFGMLALADRLVVTADSVSMVSEALATGRPVNLLPLNGKSKRHDAFIANLGQRGLVAVTGPEGLDLFFKGGEAVDATPEVAAIVRERLLGAMANGETG
ncbi:mitochondrial fission ELM1 family protein [Afifella pfennigii]|uniref:mitochondrial fission ELM1 family protein n=1 Tax=Afifella pfennigii TaxID=209897 RepID=UPI001AEC6287|nr:mitochondrial fission ELM1 family protein [Afifella pfennigii]